MQALEESLSRFVTAVKENLAVEAVVLFGSRARGDHLADSDVDLAVVSSDFQDVPRPERAFRLLAFWRSTVPGELLGFTPQELSNPRGILRWDILEDGVALFDTGTFAEAQRFHMLRKEQGELTKVPGGWWSRQ